MEKSFIEKVIAVQSELKAPKGQTNSFGKYKYRSAEDILEAVKPLLAKYQLCLMLSDEPVLNGEWHYIHATAKLTDGEKDIVASAYARESLVKKGMDDSQITGTASSYARKYALNGLFLIDDTKDADTDEHASQTNTDEKKVSKLKAKAIKEKAKNLTELINVKKGTQKSEQEVWNSLTNKKFLEDIPAEELTEQQFLTVNRYADELENFYKKM